jgi:hypothetical protein
MVSHGVDVYAYASPAIVQSVLVQFSVPGGGAQHSGKGTWSYDHLEVDSSQISGLGNFTGRFSFTVKVNNTEVTTQYNDISSWSGNVMGGTMISIRNTQCIRKNGVAITYGFYDAGSGQSGLTNRDQCWLTVTPDFSDWMRDAAPLRSSQADKPFRRFVLPCPHDCGMNSMESTDALLQHVEGLSFLINNLGTIPVVGSALRGLVSAGSQSSLVSDIIYGLAITQKDTVANMMAVGARYFEFRPGRLQQGIRQACGMGDN